MGGHENFLLLFQFILPGLWVTASVTLISLAIGFVLGLLMAAMRIYGGPIFSGVAACYSIAVRAVPTVVIIFILYFVISKFVDLSPFVSGALALGFATGAYQSEVFRGAILSVPQGQMIAARAVGMSRFKAIFNIVLPQAIRLAIPAWTNEATLVLKDSTLVYAIGVPEILRRAQYASARTLEPLAAYCTAAVLYLTLAFIISRSMDALERRYKILM